MSDQSKAVTFEGVFDVVDIRPKRHTSGNRLEIVLSVNYHEDLHKEAIPMLYKQVKVFMVEYEAQQEIDFAVDMDGPEEVFPEGDPNEEPLGDQPDRFQEPAGEGEEELPPEEDEL